MEPKKDVLDFIEKHKKCTWFISDSISMKTEIHETAEVERTINAGGISSVFENRIIYIEMRDFKATIKRIEPIQKGYPVFIKGSLATVFAKDIKMLKIIEEGLGIFETTKYNVVAVLFEKNQFDNNSEVTLEETAFKEHAISLLAEKTKVLEKCYEK